MMIFLLISSLLFYGLVPTNSERLHKQIYSSISGTNTCFRRLNGTHQMGCSSPINGAVGVIQMIKSLDDAKWLITDAVAGPYMAVVNTLLFNNVIELFLENPENIAGVLVYDRKDAKRPMSFSLDTKCPNEYYSSDSEYQCSSTKPSDTLWNIKGSGLMRRDIPFAMLYSPIEHNDDINKIEECYERFNADRNNQRGRPLCSIEINAFMMAAASSDLCMKRSLIGAFITRPRVCDPIGDYNVYLSLFPRSQKKDNNTLENITMVTARIDAASLFDSISPGAASSVVGMVTLMSTATLLSKMIPEKDADKYNHNILFTLINSEAFDYAGSQRIAYDIGRGQWPESAPLSPESIKLHVEIGQIGGSLLNRSTETPNPKWPMYAFTPNTMANTNLMEFINEMAMNYNQFEDNVFPKFTPSIPPSSIHSFRRLLSNYTSTEALPEVVLVDHDEEFTNMFYNSVLDDYTHIGYNYRNISIGDNGTFLTTEELIASGAMNETDMQVKISRLVTALARTLYKKVVDANYTGPLSASAHLIDELLYCYTRSQACPLMQAAVYGSNSPDQLSPDPPSMYVSVFRYTTNPATFTGQIMALLTGTEMGANNTACKTFDKPGYNYYWLRGWNHTGVCYQTSTNMSDALSPAFIIEDYDLASGVYSSWTESVWQDLSARIFVTASGGGATAAAVSGFCATLIAAFLTYWMQKHKDIVFVNAVTLTATENGASGILRTVNC